MSFVHLHAHSHYSLLEAPIQVNSLTKRVSELGMKSIALTDKGNLFGAIEFYLSAKESGIKPIIGMEAYLATRSRFEREGGAHHAPLTHLVLLAENYQGYQNLCYLSTLGYQEGFYYKPRIDYELLKKYNNGLLILSGGVLGEIPMTFMNEGYEQALEKIDRLKEIFHDRFYLEIIRTGLDSQDKIVSFLVEASKIKRIPLVATNEIYYLNREDQIAQEVLVCISTNKTLQDESRYKLGSHQYYLKSPEQMRHLFHDYPQACDETINIADRCNVEFRFKDDQGKTIYHLPKFSKDGMPEEEIIKKIAYQGLEARISELNLRGEAPLNTSVYFERLEYELSIIHKIGFNGYFLIVQDFINWAKARGIPVGPGRGSGAGSLVSYALNITDLDPVFHKLVFERFLNPERVSMPDFDIDFCQDRRGEVIQYVTERYGTESVSQIITYGKLQARAAMRDVGRVLAMTYSEVDAITKLVPDKLGITLAEAIHLESRLKEQMELDPRVGNLMDLAQRIEGLVRHVGIHAAGVIIADGRLVEYAPLYKGIEGENVIQYDMKHAEKIGLIKFDFLGLKTLTHIQNVLDLVEKNRGQKITTKDIPLNDPSIYQLIASGDTAGVFQFEGEGITEIIKKIKPSCFSDITAINALYRPGPMEMIPEYTARKRGEKKVEYLFPELEEILSETYGVIIYQEQVQLIAAKIAKYSLGEADILRKAMGKKIHEEMVKQRSRFLTGASENGFCEKKASELFSLMEEFAKYGFNKAHATAYCVLTAQTAWLKSHFPVEFYAALLSTEMHDTDKIVKYIKDARNHEIVVEPPDISISEHNFCVSGDKIIFGLGAVKGVGSAAMETILEARHQLRGFKTLEFFFDHVDLRKVNKKVIECLIKSGAFDTFGYHRAQLFSGYQKFMDWSEKKRREREIGQPSLFSLLEDDRLELEERPSWGKQTQLAYEKEVLGFFLSDHPLNEIGSFLKVFVEGTISELKIKSSTLRVAGLIVNIKELITKKGSRMAFATLEDLTDSVDLVIFPDVLSSCELALKSEQPVIVTGKFEDSKKLMVEKIQTADEFLNKTRKVTIRVEEDIEKHLAVIKEILTHHPGNTKVALQVHLPEVEKTVVLDVKNPSGIQFGRTFFEEISSKVGRTDFFEISS